jgi:hypothetical protein
MMRFIGKLLLCVCFMGFCLYSFLNLQNEMTEFRMQLPKLAKEVKAIHEENERLLFEIERFENPCHLMELARRPEFSHLKHPLFKEIMTLNQDVALAHSSAVKENISSFKSKITLAVSPNP